MDGHTVNANEPCGVGSVCKVGTQDPENLDEELKPLVTVWWVPTVHTQTLPSHIHHFIPIIHVGSLRSLPSDGSLHLGTESGGYEERKSKWKG